MKLDVFYVVSDQNTYDTWAEAQAALVSILFDHANYAQEDAPKDVSALKYAAEKLKATDESDGWSTTVGEWSYFILPHLPRTTQ